MTLENMVLSETGASSAGVVYNKTLSMSGAETSDAISLPEVLISDIAIQKTSTGTCNLYATAGTPIQIEADSNVWDLWDGYSQLSKGITAIYVNNVSGDATVCITVRGK